MGGLSNVQLKIIVEAGKAWDWSVVAKDLIAANVASRATVYKALRDLVDRGILVTSLVKSNSWPPKRIHKLLEKAKPLAEALQALPSLYDE